MTDAGPLDLIDDSDDENNGKRLPALRKGKFISLCNYYISSPYVPLPLAQQNCAGKVVCNLCILLHNTE